jgi:hypothetical protein
MPQAHVTTLYSPHNYGAMLQAHALQQVLAALGVTPSIIDVGGRHRRPRLLDFSSGLRGLARSIKKAPFLADRRRRYESFDRFLREHIPLSETFSSVADLQRRGIETDLLICGSDQIWNPSLAFQPEFFLRFGTPSIPRVAYAASFGSRSLAADRYGELRDLLEPFAMVSCREASGCNIAGSVLGRNVEHVVDPTLLVPESYWKSLASPVASLPKKFLLLYALEHTQSLEGEVAELAQALGLPVVAVDPSDHRMSIPCERVVRDAGPREFLWLFANASFVVTNSFHGNIFSLIFRRPFYSVPHRSKNERMASLLGSLALQFRQNFSEVKKRLRSDEDYGDISDRLEVLTRHSVDFLKRAVALTGVSD